MSIIYPYPLQNDHKQYCDKIRSYVIKKDPEQIFKLLDKNIYVVSPPIALKWNKQEKGLYKRYSLDNNINLYSKIEQFLNRRGDFYEILFGHFLQNYSHNLNNLSV